jgi:hypothetical protein
MSLLGFVVLSGACVGPPGPAGLACWDLNGNGAGDPGEDVDADGVFDVLDCLGLAGPAGPPGNLIPPGSEPTGIWQYVSGPIFSGVLDSQPQYFVFNQDGTATLYFQHTGTGVLTCMDALHALVDDSTMILDVGRVFIFSGQQILLYNRPNANTLELVDITGETSTFTLQTAVPAAFQCRSLTVVQTFGGLAVFPSNSSGLVYDGTDLWFTEDNGDIYPVNPGTGVVGATVTLSGQYDQVNAMQGGDFWLHCGCGGSEEAQRRTNPAGVVVDQVNTDTDLGQRINIDAMAYDSSANVLWLQGRDAANVRRFLSVNSNAEPDLLLGSSVFDVSLNGMTWDGTNMWALADFGPSAAIVQIDMTTFSAVATYETPDSAVDWRGIAAVGGNLFLIGRDNANQGVLMEVSP